MNELAQNGLKPREYDLKAFLRDRLWYRPDHAELFKNAPEDKGKFEQIVAELSHFVAFSTELSNDEMLVKAHDFLVSRNHDERYIALAVALIEGGLAVVSEIIELRGNVHAQLRVTVDELRGDKVDAEGDDELIGLIEDEVDIKKKRIKKIKKGTFLDLVEVMKEEGVDGNESREITPFEEALVRSLAPDSLGDPDFDWSNLREQAAKLLCVSKDQIDVSNARIFEGVELKGIAELIDEARKRFENLEIEESDEPEKIASFSVIYDFLEEGSQEYEYVKSLEPEDKTVTPGKIPDHYKPYILAAIALTPEQEKTNLRKVFAELLDCKLAQVSGLTAYLSGDRRKVLKNPQLLSAVEAIEGFQQQLQQQPQPSDVLGITVDYDNKLKEVWRKKWFEYVEKQITPEQRAKMKVLCLPGPECLEIPGYIELGFDPKNIVGIEGDPKVREEFEKNAAKYGIQTRFGKLSDVLPKLDDKFDVVSLDMLGPFCKGYEMNILSQLPLSDRVVFMINVQAKREAEFAKEQLRYQVGHHDAMKNCDITRDGFGTLRDSYLGKNKDDDAKLGQARQIGFPSMLPTLLGRLRSEHVFHHRDSEFFEQDFDFIESNETPKDEYERENFNRRMIQVVMTEIMEGFGKFLRRYLEPELAHGISFGAYLNIMPIIFDKFILFDYKQYRYLSNSTKARSPFITTCCTIEKPAELRSLRRVADFFYTILKDYLKTRQAGKSMDAANIVLNDRKGMPVRGRKWKNNDVFHYSGVHSIADLKKGDFFGAQLEATTMYKRMTYKNLDDQPPEEIIV